MRSWHVRPPPLLVRTCGGHRSLCACPGPQRPTRQPPWLINAPFFQSFLSLFHTTHPSHQWGNPPPAPPDPPAPILHPSLPAPMEMGSLDAGTYIALSPVENEPSPVQAGTAAAWGPPGGCCEERGRAGCGSVPRRRACTNKTPESFAPSWK